jgi:hypothetical protein
MYSDKYGLVLQTLTNALLPTKIKFKNVSVCEVLDFCSDDVEDNCLIYAIFVTLIRPYYL